MEANVGSGLFLCKYHLEKKLFNLDIKKIEKMVNYSYNYQLNINFCILQIHIRPGDILGNVSEAITFGSSAFLSLDLKRKRLRVESKCQVT